MLHSLNSLFDIYVKQILKNGKNANVCLVLNEEILNINSAIQYDYDIL